MSKKNEIRIESGYYARSLSLLTFSFPISKETAQEFNNANVNLVDGQRSELIKACGVSEENFDTETAKMMKQEIQKKVKELGLLDAIGYSPQTYTNDETDRSESSLYNLLTLKVYPTMDPYPPPNTPSSQRHPSIYTVNSWSLRADLNKGNVTYDDIVNIEPYQNTWCAIRDVDGRDFKEMLNGEVPMLRVNENGESNADPMPFQDRFYINASAITSEGTYDIVTSSYDCETIHSLINKYAVTGKEYTKSVIDDLTRETFINYVRQYMALPSPSTFWSKHGVLVVSLSVVGFVILCIAVAIAIIFIYRRKRSSSHPDSERKYMQYLNDDDAHQGLLANKDQ